MAHAGNYSINYDGTQQTRLFIRMVDKLFDCLNAKGPQMAKLKRKDSIAPYMKPSDERFNVSQQFVSLRLTFMPCFSPFVVFLCTLLFFFIKRRYCLLVHNLPHDELLFTITTIVVATQPFSWLSQRVGTRYCIIAWAEAE